MQVAVAIDADRRHRHGHGRRLRPSIWMTSGRAPRGPRRAKPWILARQRHKAPGNGRLRGAVATRFRQVIVGQTDRAYLRVDTFRTIRLSAHSSNRLPSRAPASYPGTHMPSNRIPVALQHFHARRGMLAQCGQKPSDNPVFVDDVGPPLRRRGAPLRISANGLDPGRQNRSLFAEKGDCVRSRLPAAFNHMDQVAISLGRYWNSTPSDILSHGVVHSLLGLQHPEPNGSREIGDTYLNGFQLSLPGGISALLSRDIVQRHCCPVN